MTALCHVALISCLLATAFGEMSGEPFNLQALRAEVQARAKVNPDLTAYWQSREAGGDANRAWIADQLTEAGTEVSPVLIDKVERIHALYGSTLLGHSEPDVEEMERLLADASIPAGQRSFIAPLHLAVTGDPRHAKAYIMPAFQFWSGMLRKGPVPGFDAIASYLTRELRWSTADGDPASFARNYGWDWVEIVSLQCDDPRLVRDVADAYAIRFLSDVEAGLSAEWSELTQRILDDADVAFGDRMVWTVADREGPDGLEVLSRVASVDTDRIRSALIRESDRVKDALDEIGGAR